MWLVRHSEGGGESPEGNPVGPPKLKTALLGLKLFTLIDRSPWEAVFVSSVIKKDIRLTSLVDFLIPHTRFIGAQQKYFVQVHYHFQLEETAKGRPISYLYWPKM